MICSSIPPLVYCETGILACHQPTRLNLPAFAVVFWMRLSSGLQLRGQQRN